MLDLWDLFRDGAREHEDLYIGWPKDCTGNVMGTFIDMLDSGKNADGNLVWPNALYLVVKKSLKDWMWDVKKKYWDDRLEAACTWHAFVGCYGTVGREQGNDWFDVRDEFVEDIMMWQKCDEDLLWELMESEGKERIVAGAPFPGAIDAGVKQGTNPPQEIDRDEENATPEDHTTIAGISNESHDNNLPFAATSLSLPSDSLRSTFVSAQTSSLVSDSLKAKKEFETVPKVLEDPEKMRHFQDMDIEERTMAWVRAYQICNDYQLLATQLHQSIEEVRRA